MWVLAFDYCVYPFLYFFFRWLTFFWFVNSAISFFFTMKRFVVFLILVSLLIYLNYNYFILTFFLVLLFVTHLSFTLFLCDTKLVDFTARTLLDNLFFNNFFFLWTNLWYIFSYFIILSLMYVTFKNKIVCLPTLRLSHLWVFVLVSLHFDFINYNFFNLDIFLFPYKENSLLINSINKVHPLLLHSTLSIFILYFFLDSKKKLQYNNFFINFFYKYIKKSVSIVVFTLYLGSWWALQEGSWGGWWNWDISEVFGLIIFFRIVLYFHHRLLLRYTHQLIYYTKNSLYYFIFFYCSMQVNFTIVSHNFGFRSLKAFNPELFYLVLLITILLLLFKNFLLFTNNFLLLTMLQKPYISLKYFYFIFIVILFSVSIINLSQNFLWNILEFKIAAVKFEYRIYFIFLLVICLPLIIFFNLYLIIFLLLLLTLLSINLFYILLFFFQNFNTRFIIYFLHFIIFFTFLNTSFMSLNSIDSWWIFVKNYDSTPLFNYTFNSTKIDSFYNFVKQTTSPEGKSFNLSISKSFLVQQYFPSGEPLAYFTWFIDISIIILNILFFLIILVSLFIFLQKCKF